MHRELVGLFELIQLGFSAVALQIQQDLWEFESRRHGYSTTREALGSLPCRVPEKRYRQDRAFSDALIFAHVDQQIG